MNYLNSHVFGNIQTTATKDDLDKRADARTLGLFLEIESSESVTGVE